VDGFSLSDLRFRSFKFAGFEFQDASVFGELAVDLAQLGDELERVEKFSARS
jgi:hypothetical protein